MVWAAFFNKTKGPFVFLPPKQRTPKDFMENVYQPPPFGSTLTRGVFLWVHYFLTQGKVIFITLEKYGNIIHFPFVVQTCSTTDLIPLIKGATVTLQ
jgi:hypothetical protein